MNKFLGFFLIFKEMKPSIKINLVPIDRDFFFMQYEFYFIGIYKIYILLNEKSNNFYDLSLVGRIIDITASNQAF